MRELPFDLRFELGDKRVHLVHGSPRKVNEYLFEDKPAHACTSASPPPRPPTCSSSATPTSPGSTTYGGVLFVNCGSVGKPKDGDPRGALRGPRAATERASRSRSSASTTTPRRSRAKSPPPGLPGEFAEKLLVAA